MIELLVGMVIVGILAALGTSGWLSYQRTVEHRGSAQELVSALRNAQQASLAEAVTYCVAFDTSSRSYQVFKFACDSTGTSVKQPAKTQSSRVSLTSAVFLQNDGSTNATVSFFPRGSATKGSVKVKRQGADKTYTISVEGLTGRVSLQD
jgi:type II secretory pathway pseudopilin PulG